MKKQIILLFFSACSGFLSQAAVEKIVVKHSDAFMSALKKTPLCDLKVLSQELETNKTLGVRHVYDDVAEYEYYAISDGSSMNADQIRLNVCKHVSKNKCHVFWGNIFNLAFVAQKPTAAFPLDTTPHYVLSPDVTCDALISGTIEKMIQSDKQGFSLGN